MAAPAPEELGTWHDADTLGAAWRELPAANDVPGAIGWDLVAGSRSNVIEWLQGQNLPVPGDDEVAAKHRMAQLYFARSLWATTNTNAANEQLGTPGYQVRAHEFIRQARELLGHGVVFG